MFTSRDEKNDIHSFLFRNKNDQKKLNQMSEFKDDDETSKMLTQPSEVK